MSKKKKRLIMMGILLTFIFLVTYFYKPIPFRFIKDDQISILYTARVFGNTKIYSIQADSLEFNQMKEIFEKYSYHRCFSTIFGDGRIAGSRMFDISTEGCLVSISDVPQIVVDGKFFQMGYWGSSEIKDLNNELLEILSKIQPFPSHQ